MSKPADQSPANDSEMADYLDMPADRRIAAKAHIKVVTATVRKVALQLPLSADVDDFRRILTAEAGK